MRRGPAVRTAVVVSAGSYRPYYYRPYFYGAYFSPFYYSPFYGGFYSGWFGTLNIRVQPGDAVVIIDGEQWDSPEGAAASSCSWPADRTVWKCARTVSSRTRRQSRFVRVRRRR